MPWKPGQSGNPKGRPPKNKTLTDALERALKKKDVKRGYDDISRKDAIAEILTQEALKGNLKAIDMILDRIEGRPGQSINLDADVTNREAPTILLEEYDQDSDEQEPFEDPLQNKLEI